MILDPARCGAIITQARQQHTTPPASFTLAPYEPANEKIVEFHASKARIRALFGGNRSSKSESAIVDDLRLLLNPNRKALIATVSNDMLGRVMWPKIKKYLPHEAIKKIAWTNPARQIPGIVTLTNDSQIHLLSYEMGREKFQGFGGFHRVHFDEESPHDVALEAIRGVIDCGGDFVMSMTPLKGLTWVYDEIYMRAGKDPNVAVWTISLLENKHIAQADKDFFISRLSADEIEKRIHGRFTSLTGAVWKEFDESRNVIKRFPIPSDWERIRVVDWGYVNPFCCLWMARNHDGDIYVYQEYYQTETLICDHAAAILARDQEGLVSPDTAPACVTTVADHDPQDAAEIANYGIYTTPARKDVRTGIELVNRLFKVKPNGRPSLYIFDDLEHTIAEARGYHYAAPNDKRNASEEPVKKDDHTQDALRYGCMFLAADTWDLDSISFAAPMLSQPGRW